MSGKKQITTTLFFDIFFSHAVLCQHLMTMFGKMSRLSIKSSKIVNIYFDYNLSYPTAVGSR